MAQLSENCVCAQKSMSQLWLNELQVLIFGRELAQEILSYVSECCLLKNEMINFFLGSIPALGISYLVPSTHQRYELPWSRLLSVCRDKPWTSGSHDSLLLLVLCLLHSSPTVLTPGAQREQSSADNGLQGGNMSKAVTGPGAGSCEQAPSTTNSSNME